MVNKNYILVDIISYLITNCKKDFLWRFITLFGTSLIHSKDYKHRTDFQRFDYQVLSYHLQCEIPIELF